MKAPMKRRLDKLEAARSSRGVHFVIFEADENKPMEQVYAEAGIEPKNGDISFVMILAPADAGSS